MATIFSVDPIWTVSTYLANMIGEIAADENKYQQLLTRINKVFLSWLSKKQATYLCTELCTIITKNTLRIRKICSINNKSLNLEILGTS